MSEDPRVILLIEDEAHTRALLHVTLRQHGFHRIHASTGVGGAAAAIEHDPSLVLLDSGLPRPRRCRGHTPHPPGELRPDHRPFRTRAGVRQDCCPRRRSERLHDEAVSGRRADGQDRVALRSRSPNLPMPPETGTVMVGELSVDFDARRVAMAGSEVALTPTEYRLLGR